MRLSEGRSRGRDSGRVRLVGMFRWICLSALGAVLVPPPAGAQSVPVAAGYRDFDYGWTVDNDPTAEKPESKLWWNDGSWWGSLWNDSTSRYEIYELDLPTQTWNSTGTAMDDRPTSHADVLWDGTRLYAVSHLEDAEGAPSVPAKAGRLYRYSYDGQSYSLDSGFPVEVNGSKAETLVLAKDTTGQLWVTWTELGKIKVNRTLGDDLTWGTPFDLPVQWTNISPDDICSIVAFGDGKIGLMWSNQYDQTIYFAAHLDSKSDMEWGPREAAVGYPGSFAADDHINLAMSCGSGGEVYAVTKTSLSVDPDPLIYFLKRSSAGTWSDHVFSVESDDHTRPVVVIDDESQMAYVFATATEGGRDGIYVKSTSLANPSFVSGTGTPFILSDTELNINNPTATKQCVNGTTGILVLASDADSREYFHNYLDLGANKPAISTVTPSMGEAGQSVTILGLRFTGTTDVAFNGTSAPVFTLISDNEIEVFVPAGANTGRVEVTNPDGTGVSSTDFLVIAPPSIASFDPVSGPAREEVTIAGVGFGGVTGVYFNGVAATNVILDGDTQIRTEVPIGSSTGKIVVANAVGTDVSPGDFTVVTSPVLVTHEPMGGIPGEEVTITGMHFTGATGVTFGGVAAASFTVDSNLLLRAEVPQGAMTGEIAITNSEGTGTSLEDFGVFVSPVVSAFDPAAGLTGTEVSVLGSGLLGATEVRFHGAVTTNLLIISDSEIRTWVPGGTTTGPIEVVNPAGTGASVDSFAVASSANLLLFPTDDAHVRSASTTTNYGQVDALRVRGGSPEYRSYLKFDVVGLVGPVDTARLRMFVTNASVEGGTLYSTSNDYSGASDPWIENGLVWNNAPALDGTPFDSVGQVEVGTWVEWDLPPAALANGPVSFVLSSGSTNSAYYSSGEGSHPPELVIEMISSTGPGITSFEPAAGLEGEEVTILGQNFSGTTGVTFGGVVAPIFTVDNDAQLRVEVPVGAATGAIGLTTPNGAVVSTDDFIVSPPPMVLSFSPANAPVGSELTITGSGFLDATHVLFNGFATAILTIDSDTQIRADVPIGASAGRIGVMTLAGVGESPGIFVPSAPSFTVSFHPTDDAQVKSSKPDKNYGDLETIRGRDGDPVYQSYLKFDVGAAGAAVSGATLRLYVTDDSEDGGALYAVANEYSGTSDPWDEDGITWSNAPGISGAPLDAVGAVPDDVWVEFDVTSALSGASVVSFGLANASSNSIFYSSKEGVQEPELVIEVSPPPLVTGFGPPSGPAGTDVVISGTGFVGVSSVVFSDSAAVGFSVDSESQITAAVPPGAITGPIRVANPSGASFSPTEFVVIHPPVVTSLSPSSGLRGSLMQILGTGFTGVAEVTFNDSAAVFTVDADSVITATVPDSATTGAIRVSNAAGTVLTADNFGVIVSPAVASIAPTMGPVGTSVQIFGNGFTGVQTVSFGDSAAVAFTVDSDSSITATVPDSAATGPIQVTNAAGSALSAADFLVIDVPELVSFVPESAPAGASVQIFGRDFGTATAVAFHDSAAIFTIVADSLITATVPESTTTGRITITNAVGTGASATDFVLIQPPGITSFAPSSGPAGSTMQLFGTGFTGVTAVTLGDSASVLFSVDADSLITATVPDSARTGLLTVTNAAGSAQASPDFVVIQPPSIAAALPDSAVVGTTIQLFGAGFTGVTSVAFGDSLEAAFTVDSDSVITTAVPDSAVTGTIAVTNAAATGTSPAEFVVIRSPSIASFSPESGPVGATIQLSGTGFAGVGSVTFSDSLAAAFTVDSDTLITTTVPDSASTGLIRVANAAGEALGAADFVVIHPPTLAAFLPGTGPAGTPVQLFGSGFTGVSLVAFHDSAAAAFTVDSDSLITAFVPDSAETGGITVTNAAASAATTEDFVVIQPPGIASFVPESAPVAATIQLFGTGFTGVTEVTFSDSAAAVFTIDSDSVLTVDVPDSAKNGRVTVTNAAATGVSESDFVVIRPPVIASFDPGSGPVGGSVQLFGTGYTGVTTVVFADSALAAFTVDSDSVITAEIPAGAASGPIAVENAAARHVSAAEFVVIDPPLLTSFTPSGGPVGTTVQLFGTGFTGVTSVAFHDSAAALVFSVDSDSVITVDVPVGASPGKIRVTNAAGFVLSGEDFVVIQGPIVASFSPGSGPAGQSVQLFGTGFTGVTSVVFPDSASAAFTVDSDSLITATVPAGARTGRIHVENAAGPGLGLQDFVVIQPPVMTAFSPGESPVGHSVQLFGTGFTGLASVAFHDSAAAIFTVDSDSVVTVEVPAGAMTGPVTVENAAAAGISPVDFVVIRPPVITSFSPGEAPEGQTAQLFGTGFTGVTSLTFSDSASAVFTVDSDSVITASVPVGAVTGPVSLENAAATGFSPVDFVVIQPPVITSFSPEDGPVGQTVQLFGTGFTGATSLTFADSASAVFTVDSDSVITADVPVGAVTGSLTLANAAATGASPTAFVVIQPPVITSLSAGDGPVGQAVQLFGTGFTGVTSVAFHDSAAAIFTVDSDSVITADVPGGATTGPVTLVNAAATGVSPAAFVVIQPPVITSFSPEDAPVGQTVQLFGAGFTGVTSLTFSDSAAAVFTVDSDSVITTNVPAGAVTGPVDLTNAAATGASPTAFVVIQPPVITSFSPGDSPVEQTVQLFGAGFTGVTSLTFSDSAAAVFTVYSDSVITADVPAGAVTGPVMLANAAATGASATDFVVIQPPAIASFLPEDGPVGQTFQLFGTGFTGVTSLTFADSAAAVFTVDSDSVITADVPAGAVTGPMTLANAAATGASPTAFVVIQPPVISSFSPGDSPVGQAVQLFGTGFTGVTSLTFSDSAAAVFTVDSDSVITADVPAGAVTGPVSLTNVAATGMSPVGFVVIRPPVITSFNPGDAPVGQTVQVLGTGFTGVTSLTFSDSASAAFTVDSDSVITVDVPAGARTGLVNLENAAATGESPVDFVVIQPPVITSFLPGDGPAGQTVQLFGTGFTGVTQVAFHDSASAAFTVDSDSVITVDVPAGAVTGPVSLENAAAFGASPLGFLVIQPPVVTSFSPGDAPVGQTVQLFGTGFTGVTSLTFADSAAAVFTVDSDSVITADVPADAVTGPVSLENAAATGVSPMDFVVIQPPVIMSFDPASAPVGQTVQLLGTGFTAVTEVRFEGKEASVLTVVSDSLVTAEVPAGALTGPVRVTNAAGSMTSGDDFVVIQGPVITSFSPTSGPAGVSVQMTGTGFTGVTSVTFGGTSAPVFRVDSDTLLTADVPEGATTGPIEATNAAATGGSSFDFMVIHPPVITSLSPAGAPVGASIQILGTGFVGVTEVAFDDSLAGNFAVVSDSVIEAEVPASATNGPVRVTNVAGTSFSAGDFLVIRPPFVTSFTPASGPEGTEVQVSGSGFLGVTEVTFGGVAATVTSVDSDSVITAQAPIGALNGAIAVTNAAGSAASFSDFVVIQPPAISSFDPSGGPVGTTVQIFGTGFTGTTEVAFSDSAASVFSVVSDSLITADVPDSARTGPIRVVNAAGTALGTADFVVIVPPSVASFSPSSGPVALSVQIVGTGFTGVTQVAFGDSVASVFTVDSDSLITAEVPAGATTGRISITNDAGIDLTEEDFVVIPPPLIASFAPGTGPAGTSVEISGSGLSGVTTILFHETAVLQSPRVDSDSSITVDVPAGATTGKISVTTEAGVAESDTPFVVILPPVIASFSPASGPVGTEVTITASDLTTVSGVTFGGVEADSLTIVSDSSMIATVPDSVVSGVIQVTNAAGSGVSATSFVVIRPPVVSSITPASGPEGTEVSISGTGLVGTFEVVFADSAASVFSVLSDSLITATVPAGAMNGPITVTNVAGTSTSAETFVVIHAPAMSSLSPASGPAGTSVQLFGTGFTGVTSLTFSDSASAAFTVDSDSVITTEVPAVAVTGGIEVANAAGTVRSADFVVIQPPVVASLAPGEGPEGTTVQLFGTGFTGVTGVAFSDSAAAIFTVDSDSVITAQVPVGATTGPVAVTNAAATGSSGAAFVVIVPPAISSFTPPSAPTGATIQLFGTGFTGVASVTFADSASAIFTVDSDSVITADVPAGSVTGVIRIANAAGVSLSAESFVVIQPPLVTSFEPSSGPVGTSVQISGTGFTGTTEVTIGDTPAAVVAISDSLITVDVPLGAMPGEIRVTNAAGSGVSATSFVVIRPPVVSSITPASGPEGTDVSISGTGLVGTFEVVFADSAASVFSVLSDSLITTAVPAGAMNGPITVTNVAGTSTSAEMFVVIHAPAVSSFAPASGPAGASVLLFGTGFTGVTSLTFSDSAAAIFTVDSDSVITTEVPAVAVTGGIEVANAAGTVRSADFVVIQPPVVASLAPGEGPEGTTVQLFGTGFTGVTGVAFSDSSAAVFAVDSDSVITTQVPVGATTGPVAVTNAAATGSSGAAFVVIVPPAISSFTPPSAPTGATIQLFGTGFTGVTSVTFADSAAAIFTVDSDSVITADVPAGSVTGVIRTANAAGVSLSAESFVVIQPPLVTSFEPSSGPVGTSVQISGTGFTGTTEVTIGDTPAAVVAISDSLITVDVPLGAMPGEIRVTNAASSGVSATSFVVIRPPVVSSITPASGPEGTEVSISGTGLVGTFEVVFADSAASVFSVLSDSLITAGVPAGATNGPITVTNAAGVAPSPTDFLVDPPPVIASFSPPSGVVGTEVTILGANLLGSTDITFGGVSAVTVTVDSDSQVRAEVPGGAPTGRIGVVTAVAGVESSEIFLVTAPPAITTLLPSHDAQVRSASPTGNYGALESIRAREGDVSVPTTYHSYLKFDVSGLAGPAQGATLRLYVTDASIDGGTFYAVSNDHAGTSDPWAEDALTWDNAPPLGGSVLAAAGVVLRDTWLELDVTSAITGNGMVSFGFENGTTNSVKYSSKEGTHPPELVIESGSGSVPAVSSFAPASGIVGTEVTLTGSNFTGTTLVAFDGVLAPSFTVDSDTLVRVDVPVGGRTGRINVTTPQGTGISATDFVLSEPPVVSSFSPGSGPAGTEVVIAGSSFLGTTGVSFGGTPATSFTVVSDLEIRAEVPPGAPTGSIRVTNPAGWRESSGHFTVTVPPVTVTLTPSDDAQARSASPTGNYGARETIRARAGDVAVPTTYQSYLKFDVSGLVGPVQSATLRLYVTDASVDGGAFYSVSNDHVGTSDPWTEGALVWDNAPALEGTALAEAGAVLLGTWVELDVTSAISGNGKVSLGFENGSTNSVKYSSKEGTHPPELVIASIPGLAPGVSSFAPAAGIVGTEVTLSGWNFTGATLVAFDGVAAASFTVDSDTQIRATSPVGASTGPISVTTAEGTGLSPTDFVVSEPPVVSAISPSAGPAGTEVVVSGMRFLGTTEVSFGGIAATSFTVVSDLEIRAQSPAGALAGPIRVTNPAGWGESVGLFTPTALPVISTLFPSDDAQVRSASPTGNYGALETIRGREGDVAIPTTYHSYLKFDVTSVAGPVQSATLRLYVTDASVDGGTFYSVSNDHVGTSDPWTEGALTWSNAPSLGGSSLVAVGAVLLNTWVELDVTSAISGNGMVSFGFENGSTNSVKYSSKEGAHSPELVIEWTAPSSTSTGPGESRFTEAVPTIRGFDPVRAEPGMEITIVGRGFLGVSTVTFDERRVRSFQVSSDSVLVVRVPRGATTGRIGLHGRGGVGHSESDFEVSRPPEELTGPALPNAFALQQNRPNPFRPHTEIHFAIPQPVPVKLIIYNIRGQEVRRLIDDSLPAGFHRVRWNGRDQSGQRVTSGVYLYRIRAGDFEARKKMILLR